MKDHYSALPIVPKIFYKQNKKDEAKGSDSVHIVIESRDSFSLWFGESKFYNSIENARLDKIISSVKLFEQMLRVFAKGKESITKFLDKIWKQIAEWFVKNKKAFGKFVNRTGIYSQRYLGNKLLPLVKANRASLKFGKAGKNVVNAVDKKVLNILNSGLSKNKLDKLVMVSGMVFKQGTKTSKSFTKSNFLKSEIGKLSKSGKYIDELGKPSIFQKFINNMHPTLKKRYELHLKEIANGLNASANDIARAGVAGSHGEIRALNALLKAIDPKGIKYGDDVFKHILGYNRFLRKGANKVQPPCVHCHFMTNLITFIGL